MNLAPILIAIVIGSSMILAMYSYYDEVNTIYKPTGIPVNSENFTSFRTSYSKVNNLMDSISNKTTDITSKGLSWNTVQDSAIVFFDIAGLMTQSPTIVKDFVAGGVHTIFGIADIENEWFVSMITTIIMIVIISLIVAILLKRPTSEI